jgi:mRNA-degrading endonuclease RelE of RelBE toxin-antitoxin system
MKQDIENYIPKDVEFVLDEDVREEFPTELDFRSIPNQGLQSKRDCLKFVGKEFTCTFPDGEYVTRKMDAYEKGAIREEYCALVENILPERKRQLEEAVEEAKRMKKEAEERYAAALQEVASMAAEVKLGTVEMRLKGSDTFCIAIAGYYLFYTWNEKTQTFVLAKGYEVPDATDIFTQDENNRAKMLEYFGAEFPYPETKDEEDGIDAF